MQSAKLADDVFGAAKLARTVLLRTRSGSTMTGAPVKLVGVGARYASGVMGPSHHAIEDMGLMRSLPGMTVLTRAARRLVKGAA